jgi:hypothetical protein
MKNPGCLVWLALLFIVGAIGNALKDPNALIFLGVVVVLVVGIVIMAKRGSGSKRDHSDELLALATDLDTWAAGDMATGTALTKGDEVALFDLPNVDLLDFKSTGSTYSGGNAGISFPIVGRIRGHVGGSQGQITRNPEQLMIVDNGTLKITSARIIFVGAKEAREIAISKLLDVELGPNGLWAKLAISSKAKREGFQHMAVDQIPIGMAIGIANEWANGGQAAAKKYALSTAEDIRKTLAAEAEAKANKKKKLG